jgi:hypothetical protein
MGCGVAHFKLHPTKEDTARPLPHFGSSLQVKHVVINNATAIQISIGWHNLRKSGISNNWHKLWSRTMDVQQAKIREKDYAVSVTKKHTNMTTKPLSHTNKCQAALIERIRNVYFIRRQSELPMKNPLQWRHTSKSLTIKFY